MSAPDSRPHHYHRPVLGILLALSAGLSFSGVAICVRFLGKAVPTGEMVFVSRGILCLATLACMAWHPEGFRLLKAKNWRAHALRSLAGTAAIYTGFVAFALMPVADVQAIRFTEPLFITALAIPLLGERIHRYRGTALVIGFIGVLIMIGPRLSLSMGTGTGSAAGILFALATAVSGALAMIFLRGMSGTEHAHTINFYNALTAVVLALITALWGWRMPTLEQGVIILLASLLGVLTHFSMTFAYRYAEASTLAPLDYVSMVWAALLGYAFFHELPDPMVWVGTPLVIATGLVIFWREYTLQKPLASEARKLESGR